MTKTNGSKTNSSKTNKNKNNNKSSSSKQAQISKNQQDRNTMTPSQFFGTNQYGSGGSKDPNTKVAVKKEKGGKREPGSHEKELLGTGIYINNKTPEQLAALSDTVGTINENTKLDYQVSAAGGVGHGSGIVTQEQQYTPLRPMKKGKDKDPYYS